MWWMEGEGSVGFHVVPVTRGGVLAGSSAGGFDVSVGAPGHGPCRSSNAGAGVYCYGGHEVIGRITRGLLFWEILAGWAGKFGWVGWEI